MKDKSTNRCPADRPEENAAVFCHGIVHWLPVGLIVGLAGGWISSVAAQRFAPLIVFPIIVGVMLGVVLVALARLFYTERRQTLLAAALLGSLVAVCADHYFCYLEAKRKMAESKTIKDAKPAFAEIMRDRLPQGPFDYLRSEAAAGRPMPFGKIARGPMAWISWGVDALLLIAGAMAVVFLATSDKKTEGNEGNKEFIRM